MNVRKRRDSALYCFNIGETLGNLPRPFFFLFYIVVDFPQNSYIQNWLHETTFSHIEPYDKLYVDTYTFVLFFFFKISTLLLIINIHVQL